MSVGARGVFNAAYGPLLFDVTSIPFPASGVSGRRSMRLSQHAGTKIPQPLLSSL